TLKHSLLLCLKTLTQNSTTPTRYKASREARLGMLKGQWKQLEATLTKDTLTLSSNSMLFWPKRRTEHTISLHTSYLRLFLMSPLDSTFCLCYASAADACHVTFVFQARTPSLSQEWYRSLYALLPKHAKLPLPLSCEVYVPAVDLRVHLPLQTATPLPSSSFVTAQEIKQAVLSVLQQDEIWASITHETLVASELGLCWTHKDRAEWIYWKNTVEGQQRSDSFIGPHSIEQTHQLELRHIEHTPQQVRLQGNSVLEVIQWCVHKKKRERNSQPICLGALAC
ncbi:hypothetical protein BDF14DRAFT_1725154, partial [Spinellus fusiger]